MSETGTQPIAPRYSTRQRSVAVHIADDILTSWVAVDGIGIHASKIVIVADARQRPTKLLVEIPMAMVEIVP